MKTRKDKVFLDSDVILDLLTEREPHFEYVLQIFILIQSKKIQAFTSPVVIANVFYIIAKHYDQEKAYKSIIKLKSLIKVLNCGENEIERALVSDFTDFEDSIQYYTALHNKIDFIITRNIKDYKFSELPVLKPKDYVQTTK